MPSQRKIAVVGLGYVGLTMAVAFSQKGHVVAFDASNERIDELQQNLDHNEEVAPTAINSGDIFYTHNPQDLALVDFYIVCVPTPLDTYKRPDLAMLINASRMVGSMLKPGDIVVYESSVYPGATEELCVPILEEQSGLKYLSDFNVGFSPERINPSDKEHVFDKIVKIVSGSTEKTLEIVASVYESVVEPGVYRVSNMRTAEATKLLENTQRDVNIALMNDYAMLLHRLDIDTQEVIAAMKTKWNYIPAQPGLVGGHCIGVNSYYIMHKAEALGYHSPLIYDARRINEGVVDFIVSETIKNMALHDIPIKKARLAILGFTYKENCPDLRDSRVYDILKQLNHYGIQPLVHDPIAYPEAAFHEYKIQLTLWDELNHLDGILLCVAHQFYRDLPSQVFMKKLNNPGLIMDIKGILNPDGLADSGIKLWRL